MHWRSDQRPVCWALADTAAATTIIINLYLMLFLFYIGVFYYFPLWLLSRLSSWTEPTDNKCIVNQ